MLAGGFGLLVGPVGAASASGAPSSPAGVASAKAATLVSPLSSVSGVSAAVPPGGHGIATVACPAGKIVSGGGGVTSGFDIEFTDSTASGSGWLIRGTNHGGFTQNLTATAVCLGLS